MAGILERIEKSDVSRRQFVGMAATVGVATGLGLTGCENRVVETEKPLEDLEQGEWIPALCLQNDCCRRCYNQVYVVDGVIVRQNGDNRRADDTDNPQQRPCVKGRSLRYSLNAADRLKYPMKRKSWQPGGGDNVNGQLRGIDEWERISWDEATDFIASELIRIRDTYGNKAILGSGEILNCLGGSMTCYGGASQGGLPAAATMMKGLFGLGILDSQDRMALRSSKLIVYFGFNPGWSSPQFLYDFMLNKRAAGQKVILIDPFFSPTVQAYADQWIPVRTGTDGALIEALAYEMITNNLQDQEFLDKYTLGFDAEHMPADAKTNENFKDYILGAYDGVPKTAEWASAICGTDPEVIKELAREIATTKPASIRSTGAPARTYYGHRFAQLFYTLGWMTGNVGRVGSETTAAAAFFFGYKDMQNFVLQGSASGFTSPQNTVINGAFSVFSGYDMNAEAEYGIPMTESSKAVVTGQYSVPGGGTKECDIKCIYRDGQSNMMNQYTGGHWAPEAYRKVEFVMVQDLWFISDAKYADIVLPIKSTLEIDYTVTANLLSQAEFLTIGRKAIEPYFECKSDAEARIMIADKLGISEEDYPRLTDKDVHLANILASTVLKEDGTTRENLLSITQEDLDELGIEGTPQEGRMPVMDFLKVGAYQVDRREGDNLVQVFDSAFIDDPEANPVNTTSGKFEIYCQKLKDMFDTWFWSDIDALPKYKPMVEGYEQSLNEPEFNLQLISIHHLRQMHSVQATCAPLNELFANDFLMSEYDAKQRNLKKGDWVLISTAEGGKIARRLNVLPTIVPGTVIYGQGNWIDIDEETGVDIGGNINTITRSQLTGEAIQAYNSILVKVEPYSGKELLPDYLRERKTPIAE